MSGTDLGIKFEKLFAGDTTLAAMLVLGDVPQSPGPLLRARRSQVGVDERSAGNVRAENGGHPALPAASAKVLRVRTAAR